MNHAQDSSGRPAPAGGHRQGSGIVVFSSSLKLLYKNRRAEEVAASLAEKDAAPSSDLMPAILRRVCHAVLESFSRCRQAPAWIQVNERCDVGQPFRSVLIRGFGLRRDTHTDSFRIVLVLEERLSSVAHPAPSSSPASHAL